MQRAFVISILVHLALLVTVLDWRVFPISPHDPAVNVAPLSVTLNLPMPADRRGRPGSVIDEKVSSAHIAARSGSKVQARHATQVARTSSAALPVPLARQAGRPELLAPGGLDHIPVLPREVEVAYRLKLAREARKIRAGYQNDSAFGRDATVHLLLAYWFGLTRPVVLLERSSGYGELDDLAMRTVIAAVGEIPLPVSGTGGGFRMPFIIEYRALE